MRLAQLAALTTPLGVIFTATLLLTPQTPHGAALTTLGALTVAIGFILALLTLLGIVLTTEAILLTIYDSITSVLLPSRT